MCGIRTTTLATTITGVQGLTTVGYWSTAQETGGEAGGGRRELGGSVAGNTVAAEQAAGDVHWRSCLHLGADEEEEEEGQARQERRQRWQRSAAVVEATEELCPPATMWMDEGEEGGYM